MVDGGRRALKKKFIRWRHHHGPLDIFNPLALSKADDSRRLQCRGLINNDISRVLLRSFLLIAILEQLSIGIELFVRYILELKGTPGAAISLGVSDFPMEMWTDRVRQQNDQLLLVL